MAGRLIMIKDIKPTVFNFTMRLKVLRIEEQTGKGDCKGEKIVALIVSDEEGARIGIQVRQKLTMKFQKSNVREDGCYVVRHLNVGDNPKIGRPIHWTNQYRLNFADRTSFDPIATNFWVGHSGHNYLDYTRLTTEYFSKGQTVDVIGRVGIVNPIHRKESSTRITFDLHDLSQNKVSCTLWGKFAEDLDSYMKTSDPKGFVVILLHFGRINDHNGSLTVSSDWSFTRFFINTDDGEIIRFKTALNEMHGENTPSGSLAPSLTPEVTDPNLWFDDCKHTLLSTLEPEKIGLYVFQAYIISILTEPDWSYIACKGCNKKPEPIDTTAIMPDDIDLQLGRSYKCVGTCGENIKVALRYKVPVRVINTSGSTTLTLFQDDVLKFVEKSAYQLIKDLPADQFIPDEFDALFGKKILFKIVVQSYNQRWGNKNYAVREATVDPELNKTFVEKYAKEEEVDDPFDLSDIYGSYTYPGSSDNTGCDSSATVGTINTIDLATPVGDTPPSKRVKDKDPDETPISTKSSTTKATKSLMDKF